jgi:hypothetical protein
MPTTTSSAVPTAKAPSASAASAELLCLSPPLDPKSRHQNAPDVIASPMTAHAGALLRI